MKIPSVFFVLALLIAPVALAADSDQLAPLIKAINVVSITKTSAKITWNTDELATSKVVYKDGEISNPELVVNHAITLEGLRSAASYHFNVTSCDEAGNCATASGNSLTFSTTGYRETDQRIEQSNFSEAVLTSAAKIHFLNFTEQNPVWMDIDAKEALYFRYNDSEYAIIFPYQSALNTTIRLLPWNAVDTLASGEEILYDLDNDSQSDILLTLDSIKQKNVETLDDSLKYVRYQLNITVKDLNSPDVNKTEEASIKFEANPIYNYDYEPPVKEGSIGVSSAILPARKVSLVTGILVIAVVFLACMLAVFLIRH